MSNQTPGNSFSSETAPVIEGYRVLEKLGRGATSSVWKAEQISLNRLVVIKVLSERLTQEPEDVMLFKAEARLAANFKHAGIVQVYDFGQSSASRCYYFVMEYISGYSVGDWVRRKGRITEHEALIVAHAVADALKYAWDLSRIVHCDIKPDNIMVDGDGSIKVADLGLAHTVKTMVNQPGADAAEVIITGTPNYMAPEQVRGSEPIDCRTDIYALGASLYHMVTGQLPFGDSPPDIILERQLQEAFEYPQKVNPDLSTSITQLILKMTTKEPAARFQNWDEVLVEVIRLERQMRQRPAAALAERVPAADLKKDDTLAGGGRRCRYCGQFVQREALYCGFCGKAVAGPAPELSETRKQVTIRLKPIQVDHPASTEPESAVVPPASSPQRALRRWHASLGNHVSMVLTLCLLFFLGYYAYQKFKYGRDVAVPIKAAVIQTVQPVFENSRLYTEQGLQGGAQLSHRLIWARFATKPASAGDRPGSAPKKKAILYKTPVLYKTPALAKSAELKPAEKPETEQAIESESLPASAEPAALEIIETTGFTMPEETAPSETSLPEVSKPLELETESVSVPVESPQDMEYERILQTCKQQQPRAGDRITLRFKNRRAPVEGVLEQATAEGVRIKVAAGVIEYPFRLVAEESRLMFFPEEHARRLQRQQSP